jgi:hypothetical protein
MSQMIPRGPHTRKTVLAQRNWMKELQEHHKKKLEQSNWKKELYYCLLYHYLELHNLGKERLEHRNLTKEHLHRIRR